MQRKFLKQFLDKISKFPTWVKEIIYYNLSEQVQGSEDLAYVFATFKPELTDKGKCELNNKSSHFDNNTYNILSYCDMDSDISEITLNTYMSMEDVANYFLFCVDEGFIQIPDNSQVLNIAGFLAGKYRTGEYMVQDGIITKSQLDSAVNNFEKDNKNLKFGQFLVDLGFISEKYLNTVINIKDEAQRRFILDHNEVPKMNQDCSAVIDGYRAQITRLQEENSMLKRKIREMENGKCIKYHSRQN